MCGSPADVTDATSAQMMLACTVSGHHGAIEGLALNHAATLVASVGERGDVIVWSVATFGAECHVCT